MARSVEILVSGDEVKVGSDLLRAAESAAGSMGLAVTKTASYIGKSDWLCVWGVGHAVRNLARHAHIKRGGHVACWDLGYIRPQGHVRVSIDHNHPWRDFDKTPNDPSRWKQFGIPLRNDYDPDGHVLVIGLGAKSKVHLGLAHTEWEDRAMAQAQARFPKRKIVLRPKVRAKEEKMTIVQALKGASLVICRHSNVAVDACIAGVPVECEDGAAFWLYQNGPNPSEAARADFLHRLAWWQWKTNEQREAWTFLQMVCGSAWAVGDTQQSVGSAST